jgi:signal transduction histidine kinase
MRWIRSHGLDLLIGLAAVAIALDVALRTNVPEAPRSSPWFAVPASVMIVLPLFARRRWPFGAPAAVWALAAAISFADGRLVTFSPAIAAAGTAAAFLIGNTPRRSGLPIVVAAAAVIVANDPSHTASDFIVLPAGFAIAWLAGYALRQRGNEAEAAEARARLAESEREAAARVAVAEERARIARELHDVVAHAVSVMTLQVGAVRHSLPGDFAEDKDALRGVETTGRTALTEMRRLLGALRLDGEDAELAPGPGLDSLDPLLDEFRRAGLPVRLDVGGEPVALPRTLDLSAYRIVQEGLTNALKHAQASHADVMLRYTPKELRIDVRDDGRGTAPSDGLGHGLVGVRERVKIYGGDMTAGATRGGGFLLSTRLPLDGDAR